MAGALNSYIEGKKQYLEKIELEKVKKLQEKKDLEKKTEDINNFDIFIKEEKIKAEKQQKKKFFKLKCKIFKFLTFGYLDIEKKITEKIKAAPDKLEKNRKQRININLEIAKIDSIISGIKRNIKWQCIEIKSLEVEKQELDDKFNSKNQQETKQSLCTEQLQPATSQLATTQRYAKEIEKEVVEAMQM